MIPNESLPPPLPSGTILGHLSALEISQPISTRTPLCPSLSPITALACKRKTHVMSILNVTPDSFSDGGQNDPTNMVGLKTTVLSMISNGATIIDVGGQSSRPNAPDISAREEIARVVPAIKLIGSLPEAAGVAISVDTYRAAVAEAAVAAGAHIINDVSAGSLDENMLATMAKLGVTVCLMHMRGTPHTMTSKENTSYPDGLIRTVANELEKRVAAAEAAGVRRWRIILDPGIGFAKRQDQNLELLRKMGELRDSPGLRGLPWLVGTSRKGFIGKITGVTEAKNRSWGTAAAVAATIQGGADIVRVHDIEEMVQVAKMADAIWRV